MKAKSGTPLKPSTLIGLNDMIYSKKFNHEPHKPHERKREFHAKVRDVRVKSNQLFRNNPGNQSMTYSCSCGLWFFGQRFEIYF
jgi:uncharacterized short protein YbdD (DUF466 family)